MTTETNYHDFFSKFFYEFRTGLRNEDQPIIDKLIIDLDEISKIIPPSKPTQYNFREILMLISLINQRKLSLNLK